MQADRADFGAEEMDEEWVVRMDKHPRGNLRSVNVDRIRSDLFVDTKLIAPETVPETEAEPAFSEGRRRFAEHSLESCRAILACFDRTVSQRRFGDVAADADPVDVYFSDPGFARISPNLLFDEQWYVDVHPDVRDAIASGSIYSGFVHFVVNGLYEGRAPNPTMDTGFVMPDQIVEANQSDFNFEVYAQSYKIVQKFMECFPLIDAAGFYNIYGRRLGHIVGNAGNIGRNPFDDRVAHEFDHEYYSEKYLGKKVNRSVALRHYTYSGIRAGNSPNPAFDELWYRTFYPDIGQAVISGKIESGFHHYVMSGRQEGRRQAHDLKYALEARMAGVTEPRLVQRAEEIAQRMRSLPHRVAPHAVPRIWFCLPMLNPDMSFGGYKAVFELIKATSRNGHAIGIFITEDAIDDLEYFAYRERDRELVSVIKNASYVNRVKSKFIQIGSDDIFVVYSVWDAYVVQPLLKATNTKRFLLLAQEYEPIFYECGSTRALTQAAYRFDHVPLYNSRFLKAYFLANRVGPFERRKPIRDGVDYFTFEHVLTRLTVESLAEDPGTRTLAFYARPEMHAARNLFELGYLALRKLCNEGIFDQRWRFVGLGSLQDDHVLPLGNDHQIEMIQKMPLDDYARFMSSIDIGLSLMLAPHPSVVPFEFAATGAVVVTNTFENRSAEDLEGICRNIVACPPTLAGIEAALRIAVTRAEDRDTRRCQRLIAAQQTWTETFSTELLDRVFGSLKA